MAKIISVTIKTLVTLKALAKHELLFNELASEVGLWRRRSHLAAALGVTNFITIIAMHSVTLCRAAEADLLNESSSLGAALDMTKFIIVTVMNLATLCCVA